MSCYHCYDLFNSLDKAADFHFARSLSMVCMFIAVIQYLPTLLDRLDSFYHALFFAFFSVYDERNVF